MTGKKDDDGLTRALALHIAREPRTRATIRIGAMGRRQIAPEAAAQLSVTIEAILAALAACCAEALVQDDIAATFVPELDMVTISSCAEGADQIVMQAALASRRYRLGAIIPFAAADYRQTFDQAGKDKARERLDEFLHMAQGAGGYGVLALDGHLAPAEDRDRAYAQCGRLVTHWSDALVAVLEDDAWHSMTGRDVRAAIDDGVPVILVNPDRPGAYHVMAPALFGDDPHPGSKKALNMLATHLLLSGTSPARAREKRSYGFAEFVCEKITCVADPDFSLARLNVYRVRPAWSFFIRSVSGLNAFVEKWLARLLRKPKSNLHLRPFADLQIPEAGRQVHIEIALRQHRADVIASAYAELHRSVFVVVALAGVAAVVCAAFGTQSRFAATLGPEGENILSGLEAVFVCLAGFLVLVAERGAWLDRWMDCRLISEILRYSTFLLLAGRSSPLGRYEPVPDVLNEGNAWALHYTHAVLRAHSLSVPQRGLDPHPDAVSTVAAFIDQNCLADQIDYHQRTGPVRKHFGELLETASNWLGLLTLVAVVLKLAGELAVHFGHASGDGIDLVLDWLSVAAIVLPALTTGFFALKTFGEHELVGTRSQRMIVELKRARTRLLQSPSVYELGEETDRIAHVLLRHVDGWREIFAGKHIHSG